MSGRSVSKLEKIALERAAVMVTERCNLKCRLCAPMTPYWKNTRDIPLERLEHTIEELFSITQKIGKFSVGGGGEPFLYKSFPGFLEYLLQYQDRVDQFDIVTNGTIVPDKALLTALSKFQDMKVIVDDYGAEVSKQFEEVCRSLEGVGISIERRKNKAETSHYDGWFDMLELVEPPRTMEQTKEIFNQCIFSRDLRCNVIYDGKIFPCSRAVAFHRLEQIPKGKDWYMDLFDTSKTTREKRDELLRHVQAEFFPACAYCQGGLRSHQRHTPAEQLGRIP